MAACTASDSSTLREECWHLALQVIVNFPALKKKHKQNCKNSVMRPLRVLASQGLAGFSVTRTNCLCLMPKFSW